ncbi:MAG: ABC transporter permease [candidate division Zixibacteria bacterium]|nr:ABC transporter permease [candidate division Zixibacteria bacterium]
MLKNYIKIAWKVLLRRKFFTFVSLFGISFTLLVLMVAAAVIEQQYAPARPGTPLERCLYIDRIIARNDRSAYVASPSYGFLDKYARSLKQAEAVSITAPGSTLSYLRNHKIELQLLYTDHVFWDLLAFDFLEGQPYDQAAVDNADHVAVITSRTRRQFFGDDSALGRYIEISTGSFRVVGVIPHEGIPSDRTWGDIYIPVTTNRAAVERPQVWGRHRALILAPDESHYDAIKAEFQENVIRAQQDHAADFDSIKSEAKTYLELLLDPFEEDTGGGIGLAIVVLITLMLLFMLFPAINLINMNSSRIIERSSEIGVRKAFGASSKTLVMQFLVENVILTLIGGAIAFVAALVVLQVVTDAHIIPFGQFHINFRVFSAALVISLIFGLLSGVIPAYRMSRLHPVRALKGSDL